MGKEFVLLKDVVIPAGTVLDCAPDNRGGRNSVECVIGMGDDSTAYFNCSLNAIRDMPEDLISELRN